MTSLQELGFRAKEAHVYETLLDTGPLSVRKLASATDLNRGSVYEALKSLRSQGLVSHYHQRQHQYFVAEDPARIDLLLDQRRQDLEQTRKAYERALPGLRTRYDAAGGKPTTSAYEGDEGIRAILDDLLTVLRTRRTRQYAAYSSASIKPHLHRAYPGFTKRRIDAKIRVQVVSFGPGGQLRGLDERRWISRRQSAPTYTLLYADRVAHISVNDRGVPHGTVITDRAIADTQQAIFRALWNSLPPR